MKLSEAFNAKLFKNKKVADAIERLCDLEDEFNKKGQGNVLAGHIMSLSTTFKADQGAILQIIQKVQDAGGGVRIGRKSKAAKPKVKVRFVDSNNVTKPFDPDEDCEGCDKKKKEAFDSIPKAKSKTSHKETPKKEQIPRTKTPEPKKKLETNGLTDSDLLSAKSWREVMNGFLGDEDLMAEFCKMQGIKRGQEKDPTKLSKLIFKNLKTLV